MVSDAKFRPGSRVWLWRIHKCSSGVKTVCYGSYNFFEHLPSKQALRASLQEAFRCLRSGGRLIAIGPNIKFLGGRYWDFFDHYLPLTERSLAESMHLEGFEMEVVRASFLPYTMSLGLRPPIWTVRLYVRLPIIWRVLAATFLSSPKSHERLPGFLLHSFR